MVRYEKSINVLKRNKKESEDLKINNINFNIFLIHYIYFIA